MIVFPGFDSFDFFVDTICYFHPTKFRHCFSLMSTAYVLFSFLSLSLSLYINNNEKVLFISVLLNHIPRLKNHHVSARWRGMRPIFFVEQKGELCPVPKHLKGWKN